MVIEDIINPFKAEKKPWELFFIGFLYCSIAIFLSLWIFQKYASLVMVFLTVLACTPLIYNTVRMEESKDIELEGEKTILREHAHALSFFMFLFLGVTLACALWYIVLPTKTSVNLFTIQTETITSINSNITGLSVDYFAIFTKIFMNNVKVLIFCILFAFVYGMGSMFILIWNASVIGVAMGNFFRTHFAAYATAAGLVKIAGYFHISALSILRYAIHGFPEILSYFIGGLAGGIISVAVIKHEFGTQSFEKILLDSSDMIIISVLMLVIAAGLEVFVTPLFFA
ncbi:MAG: stage II sporulation protein M [Candidatus Woesearchaeota archaeon]